MPFSEDKIQKIWEKGLPIDNFDPAKVRKDIVGAGMIRGHYGKETLYGWGVDHIYPVSKGGDDQFDNLRPMQIDNNRSKKDNFPTYLAVKGFDGEKNIDKRIEMTIHEDIIGKLKLLYRF